MGNLLPLLRQHCVALGFAAIIGFICIAPYAYFATTPSYAGIALMGQDAEEHYLARIQEVYDGHPSMGNVFLPYKNTPYLIPGLGETIVAGLGKILFMTAAQVNVFSKFLFPFLAFLLVYVLGLAMTNSRATAILGATLAMLGSDFMSYPRDALYLLRGTSAQDGIYWARPINPEVSGIMLFAALLLIYRCVQHERARWWEIGAVSFLFGLSIYVSPYTWSFLGMLLLLLCGHALWRRNVSLAKQLFAMGALGALCAVPFIINLIHARQAPGYPAAALQQGILSSHAPVFGIWVFVLLLIPLFLWATHERSSRTFFIASSITLLILLNQQVLTGVYLQPGHFHWYVTKPLVGLMLGVWIAYMAKRFVPRKLARNVGYSAVILVLLLGAALAQTRFYTLHTPAARAAQTYAPLLAYLQKNQPHGVVLADQTLSSYIPIYTNADAPESTSAPLYIAPTGYFERLSTAEKNMPLDAQSLRNLGITAVVKDEKNDAWQPGPEMAENATIAGRFEVFSLLKSSGGESAGTR